MTLNGCHPVTHFHCLSGPSLSVELKCTTQFNNQITPVLSPLTGNNVGLFCDSYVEHIVIDICHLNIS